MTSHKNESMYSDIKDNYKQTGFKVEVIIYFKMVGIFPRIISLVKPDPTLYRQH